MTLIWFCFELVQWWPWKHWFQIFAAQGQRTLVGILYLISQVILKSSILKVSHTSEFAEILVQSSMTLWIIFPGGMNVGASRAVFLWLLSFSNNPKGKIEWGIDQTPTSQWMLWYNFTCLSGLVILGTSQCLQNLSLYFVCLCFLDISRLDRYKCLERFQSCIFLASGTLFSRVLVAKNLASSSQTCS